MSKPRQILPGSTYLVTRRCSERRRFLRPDGFVERVFCYLLAAAAGIHGIDVHCAIVMSNHYHAVVTDRHGRLPRFLAWFHRLLAVVINIYRGRWEALWSSAKPSVVRLETPEDALDKMVYVLSNAVAAGLVPSSSKWPGYTSSPEDLLDGAEKHFDRPERYFDPKGRTPTRAQLRLSPPPGFDDMTREAFVAELRRRLEEREDQLRAAHAAEGRSYAGAKHVLRVPWQSAPATRAPRRVRDPHIAARDVTVRCQALERLCQFRADYREAFARWRRGERSVLFPSGTYAMRVRFGVRCHDPPPAPPPPGP